MNIVAIFHSYKFTHFIDSKIEKTKDPKKLTTGEKINTTEWHNLVVRNKAAEICEKYLSKGDKVYIEGRIKSRQWQDDSGSQKYTTEIQVTEFTFLTLKKEGEDSKSNSALNKKFDENELPKNDLPF